MRILRRMKKGVRHRRVCVLASGGVDSCVLIADLLGRGHAVYPLYVRSGLRWERAEVYWLKRYLKSLRSSRLKPLTVADAPVKALWGSHWSLNGPGVPSGRSPWESVGLHGRNLILLCQAGLFCSLRGIPLIAHGVLKGNPFQDATRRFRKSMERTLSAGLGVRVRVAAPYARLNKVQVRGLMDGLPLHLAFSCLNPRGRRHCGRCSKCAERRGVIG